jgi:Ser/Thr protein kinase RdoA (MazF antagonist)
MTVAANWDGPIGDVLAGRAGVSGLRRLLCGQPMRGALHRALRNCLPTGSTVSCRLSRSKFKPGRKLTAYYEVTVSGREPDRRWIAVTWSPPATAAAAADSEGHTAEIRDRGLAAPYTRLSFDDPAHGLRLAVAPLDPRFPQLPRMCDPAYLSAQLGTYAVRAVRYRPGQRHVLRLDAPRAPVRLGARLFAKLYAGDGGARACHVGTAMAQLLSQPSQLDGGALRAPSYLPDDEVVLWPAVAGAPLSWWLRRNRQGAADRLQEAGALLRAVHDAPRESAPAVAKASDALEDELVTIGRTSAHIAALLPPVSARLADLLAYGRDRLARLPGEPPTLVHGDFKADHVLAGPRGLTLIDFDRCAWSDPALDLAKFLADLRWWSLLSGGPDSADMWGVRFLQGYGPCPAERLSRARLLEPLLLLRLAARRPRLHDPRWSALTSALVGSAERLAAQPAVLEGAS